MGGAHTLPSSAATSATYLHDYPRLTGDLGCEIVFDVPMPTHLNKVGPLYRFYLVERQQPDIQADDMGDPGLPSTLRDEVVRVAQLRLLANIHRLQMVEAVVNKFAETPPRTSDRE